MVKSWRGFCWRGGFKTEDKICLKIEGRINNERKVVSIVVGVDNW